MPTNALAQKVWTCRVRSHNEINAWLLRYFAALRYLEARDGDKSFETAVTDVVDAVEVHTLLGLVPSHTTAGCGFVGDAGVVFLLYACGFSFEKVTRHPFWGG